MFQLDEIFLVARTEETNAELCRQQISAEVEHRQKHFKYYSALPLWWVGFDQHPSQQSIFSSPSRHFWLILLPLLPSQNIFPPPAVQTLVSLSGDNWSVGWSCCSASLCYVLDVRGSRTLEPLSLRKKSSLHYKRNIMWSFFADDGGNKRGQTSRPVVGAKIQRDCNFETHMYHFS